MKMTKSNSHPHRSFDDLIEILSKEISLYDCLDEVLKKKQEAIIMGNIEELREYVLEEQSLIQKALSVAHERKNHVIALGMMYETPEEEPRLKTIIDIAPSPYSIKLMNLWHRLKAILDGISRVNRENSYLLNSSIEHVRGLVHLFLQADEKSSKIYNYDGVVDVPEENNKVLDCHI